MHVPRFITGHFKPQHLFLEDAEYGRALDALVKAVCLGFEAPFRWTSQHEDLPLAGEFPPKTGDIY